ncbi:MAG: pilus assembly protein TadG [Caulobacter sp.]|nr:pilus assembly protein TadG [Caulobacter sp.]
MGRISGLARLDRARLDWARLVRAFGHQLNDFARAKRGAVAVQFAVMALPLAVLSFGLVDVDRASTQRKQLQDALDAATLMAARSSATTDPQLKTIGDAALGGQLTGLKDATLTASDFHASGSTVIGTATLKVKPIIANLWLNGDMTVGAESEVVRSINKLEVVMVLDNTGSMASNNKLVNLKVAATNLVDTLSTAAARSTEPHPVKIGLVPFSMAVRIGSSAEVATYKTAWWMDTAGASPVNDQIFTTASGTQHANRFTLLTQMGVTWSGCVEVRPAPYDVQDTAPNAATPATLFAPYFWPDEPDTPSQSSNKNGDFGTFYNNYLTDKKFSTTNWKVPQGDITKYTVAPKSGTNSSTGYTYGPNAGCSMQPLMRLTENWSALKTSINAMTAVGETHVPSGLIWGWHVLSPNAPFSDGVAYGTAKTTKIAILMTDGDNTFTSNSNDNDSYYEDYGYIWQNRLGTTSSNEATRTTAIDNRLKLLCDNMKAKDIVIYSVGVMVSTSSKALLTYCAADANHYYDVTSSANITAAFSSIAGSIENLRISH